MNNIGFRMNNLLKDCDTNDWEQNTVNRHTFCNLMRQTIKKGGYHG